MADETRLAKLRQLIELDPEDTFSRYALAMELKGLGREDEALSELQGLLREVPDYVATYYQLALLLHEDGETAQGLEVARRGVEVAGAQGEDHARDELERLIDELVD